MDCVFETEVEKLAFIGRVGIFETAELAGHYTVLNIDRSIADAETSSLGVDHRRPKVRRRIVVLNRIDPNALSEFAHHNARVTL